MILQICTTIVLLGAGIYLLTTAYRLWKRQKQV